MNISYFCRLDNFLHRSFTFNQTIRDIFLNLQKKNGNLDQNGINLYGKRE